MAKATSIHFKKTTTFSYFHNDRSKAPSYVICEDTNNEYDKSALTAYEQTRELYASAKSNYENKFKQKFQAQNYLIEAVVVLEKHHTLDDLKTLSGELEKLTGYTTTQLAIHKDEGKDKDNLNYHGHLVFFTLDKDTGKSLQRQNFNNKEKMRQAQTITANVLNMTKDTSKEITNAEHLTHRQYKQSIKIAEQHKSQELQKWHNRLKEQIVSILETTTQAIKKFFMSEQINQMEAENIQLKQQTAEQESQINRQSEKIKSITEEAEHYKSELIQERVKHFSIQEQKEQLSQKKPYLHPCQFEQQNQQENHNKKPKSLSRSI